MTPTPWAALLCKFKDDASEPYGRKRYEELFTSSGTGKLNMVDFFGDMSHGQLDLSGSQVFGWYTLDKTHSDYQLALGQDQAKARGDLIAWARQAAAADLTEQGPFFSVVVCMNVPTDLFGGPYGAVCDDGRWTFNGMSSLSPSLLGQEMGHAYGLSHSMAAGSVVQYNDPFDVMSTTNALMGAHPSFTDLDVRGRPVFRLGPGLNAANMSGRGWLDPSRVWSSTSNSQVNTTVRLRPLHRRELPGFLAARLEQYFIEFRTNELWDAAIAPTVLVHTFENNQSYLVPDNNGQSTFAVGSFVGTPSSMSVFGSQTRIEVIEIDAAQQLATVRLIHVPANIPQYFPEDRPFRNPGVAWSVIGAADDAMIALNGVVTRISRRSPFFRALEQIALYENSTVISSTQLRTSVREDALSTISTVIREQALALQVFGQPGPLRQTETVVMTRSTDNGLVGRSA